MASTGFKLDNDYVSDRFLDDARLIGLVSTSRDYQLALQINSALHFDFRLKPGLEIELKSGRRSGFFNVFAYEEPMKSVIHYLFNNHYRADFLLPELKQFDCLWLVKGEYYMSAPEVKLLLDNVREISAVQLAAELPLDEVKNRQNLTLD